MDKGTVPLPKKSQNEKLVAALRVHPTLEKQGGRGGIDEISPAPAPDVSFDERSLRLDGRQSFVPQNDRTGDLGTKPVGERLRLKRAVALDTGHEERVPHDDDADVVGSHDVDQRAKVPTEVLSKDAPHRLSRDPERIRQRQPDADRAQIDSENPALRSAQ